MKHSFQTITRTCLLLIACSLSASAQNVYEPNIHCPGGVDVNSFSGNMTVARRDLLLKGRKLPIDITFRYNSSDRKRNTGYGNGWNFQYGIRYIPELNGVAVVHEAGSVTHFVRDASDPNKFDPAVGVFDSLREYANGKLLMVMKGGTKYFFDNAIHRRVTRIEEPNGNALSFTYADSLVTQITDGSGRAVQLTYSGGRLTQVLDANGPARTIQYQYDAVGNLTQVTDPAANTSRYGYVPNGPMNKITDKNSNVVDVVYLPTYAVKEVLSCNTDQTISYNSLTKTTYVVERVGNTNQVTFMQFDANNNLKRKTGNCCGYNVGYDYDNNKNISVVTDANGHMVTMGYDASGNMISKTDALGHTSHYTYEPVFSKVSSYTDRNGHATTFAYDAKGNVTTATFPLGVTNAFSYALNGDLISTADGNGNITTYEYDANGNPTAINKPLGATQHFTFDARSRLTSMTDPRGNVTTYAYDNLDRLVSMTDALNHSITMTYDAAGNMLSRTDRNGHTTRFAYDAMNRRTMTTDALNHSTFTAYNAKGKVLSETDPNGNTTQYGYDELNRLVSEANALSETSSFEYDGRGNLLTVTLPNGNVVSLTYDAINRPTQISDKLGAYFTYGYDAVGNLTQVTDANGNSRHYAYDALNRRTGVTDALGNPASVTYDNDFNVVSAKDFNGKIRSQAFDALNRRISFTDALGHTTQLAYDATTNLTSITDANGNATSYVYDALNRRSRTTFADGTTNLFAFDGNGDVTSFTDNAGAVTATTYDAVDRLLRNHYPAGNDDVYTYDADGNLLTAVNDDATVALTYDAANRLLSETLNGKTTAYSYDIAGNKRTTQYPGGRTIVHAFDARNRLSSITEGTTTIASFLYDNADRLLTKNYPFNGTTTSYTYDANNRMQSTLVNPGAIINSTFTYDNNGNKLSEFKAHHTDYSEQYGYDDEGRLTLFKSGTMSGAVVPSPRQEIDYAYDALGNRTTVTENGVPTHYSVNNMNAYTSIDGPHATTYQYDANGNMTSDGGLNYAYDIHNRLHGINGGAVATYAYDALGRRIRKNVGPVETDYEFSGLNEIENRNAAGDVSSSFVFGRRIDDIIAGRLNGADHAYYTNVLGSVNAITSTSGHVEERYEYEPFGRAAFFGAANVEIKTSVVDNHVLFTGRILDEESKKWLFRARQFDEGLGRFSQRDPLSYAAGDLNLYSYVFDMPTRFKDPLGLANDCDAPAPPADLDQVGAAVGFAGSAADAVVDRTNGVLNAAELNAPKMSTLASDLADFAALENVASAGRVLSKASTVLGAAGGVLGVISLGLAINEAVNNSTFGNGLNIVITGGELLLGVAAIAAAAPEIAAVGMAVAVADLASTAVTGHSIAKNIARAIEHCP